MLQVGKSNDWHWNSSDSRHMLQDLVALDATLGTHLASVGPANRASTAQGAGLLRVADIWLAAFLPTEQQGRSLIAALRAELARCGSAGHAACVFGVMGACLDLTQHETLDALHFGVARDMLTAAVRLNLVGPLHAVYMQAKLADAARSSIHVAQSTSVQVAGAGAGGVGTTSPLGGLSCRTAAGCAPLAEAAHACHDLLEMRLFQT